MKILHILSSPLGANSNSIKLANQIIDRLQVAHPHSTVIERHLDSAPLPHLDGIHLQALFTPKQDRTPEQQLSIHFSDEAIAELKSADFIVIGVPMYNFSIPSTLKSWIDHIARAGETFSYSEMGAEGLVKNKKVFLAIATGGIYSEGPMKDLDFTEPYLRKMLGFLGMTDIKTYRIEGVAIPGIKENAMEKALSLLEHDL